MVEEDLHLLRRPDVHLLAPCLAWAYPLGKASHGRTGQQAFLDGVAQRLRQGDVRLRETRLAEAPAALPSPVRPELRVEPGDVAGGEVSQADVADSGEQVVAHLIPVALDRRRLQPEAGEPLPLDVLGERHLGGLDAGGVVESAQGLCQRGLSFPAQSKPAFGDGSASSRSAGVGDHELVGPGVATLADRAFHDWCPFSVSLCSTSSASSSA